MFIVIFPQKISPQTHKTSRARAFFYRSSENSDWGPLCWVPECPWTTTENKVWRTSGTRWCASSDVRPHSGTFRCQARYTRATGCSVLGQGKFWGLSVLSLPMQMREQIKRHVEAMWLISSWLHHPNSLRSIFLVTVSLSLALKAPIQMPEVFLKHWMHPCRSFQTNMLYPASTSDFSCCW